MKVRVNKKPQKALTLKNLAKEVGLLRSFVIGMAGRDKEGAYRAEFVDDITRVSANASLHREFLSPNDFLRRIRSSV
jgi:hypothetical protein